VVTHQRFFLAFFAFCLRVDGSPAGGGGVASMARTISSKLPEIGGTVVSAYVLGRFAIVIRIPRYNR